MGKNKNAIWKSKNDLELILLINSFIEKYDIVTARDYQKALTKHPKEAPSTWFISEKYGSWDQLLENLGRPSFDRYRWNKVSDEKLKELAIQFIKENGVKSQRKYEKETVGKDLPSLSTLKKRFGDVHFLFKNMEDKKQISDFQLLEELKNEIYYLGLEESLSMEEFRKQSKNPDLPSPITILRRTNKSWEGLMTEIGFDYRKIKVGKLTKNLN
ncbi:hypothetical protein [Tetragenococcus halophilus]|uniref:hypothetical protein n=1 Tax=Tetragenococcus halophilus TaxID=51669 RepID=UPI00209AB74E|nr:hypothetical protein [Tetragenococcus halophilus]MCO8288902.1 hypothetical protein [Tetragenococcus halophilus]